jgi:hypothetical protein
MEPRDQSWFPPAASVLDASAVSVLSPMVADSGDVCRAKKSTTINQSPWNVTPGKELDSLYSTVVRHV